MKFVWQGCLILALLSVTSFSTMAPLAIADGSVSPTHTLEFDFPGLNRIPNFHEVSPGIFRGGRPTRKSDLEWLRSNGVETIINLENNTRAVREERRWAEELGMQYISRPMSWSERPDDDQVEDILRKLQEGRDRPLFIHCKHGRDRTGMIIGLFRVLAQDWSPNAAYKEMLDLGFRTYLEALDRYFKDRVGYRGKM